MPTLTCKCPFLRALCLLSVYFVPWWSRPSPETTPICLASKSLSLVQTNVVSCSICTPNVPKQPHSQVSTSSHTTSTPFCLPFSLGDTTISPAPQTSSLGAILQSSLSLTSHFPFSLTRPSTHPSIIHSTSIYYSVILRHLTDLPLVACQCLSPDFC